MLVDDGVQAAGAEPVGERGHAELFGHHVRPGAELVPTSGLGHRDLLNDPAVIGRVLAFLAAGAVPIASGTVTALEQELFNRETRRLAS